MNIIRSILTIGGISLSIAVTHTMEIQNYTNKQNKILSSEESKPLIFPYTIKPAPTNPDFTNDPLPPLFGLDENNLFYPEKNTNIENPSLDQKIKKKKVLISLTIAKEVTAQIKRDHKQKAKEKRTHKITAKTNFLSSKSSTIKSKKLKHHTCSYPYCNKAFAEKCTLTRHIITHTEKKPYTCSYCEKAFAEKGALTRHIRTHTGEKPYTCSYCNIAFAQKGTLTIHIRTHTEEKPYKCLRCSMAFQRKVQLTKHERTHFK